MRSGKALEYNRYPMMHGPDRLSSAYSMREETPYSVDRRAWTLESLTRRGVAHVKEQSVDAASPDSVD